MSYQITISDQERDILAQKTQAPSLTAQQVEQLVQEFIRNLRLITGRAGKPITQRRVVCDFTLPTMPQPDITEKTAEQEKGSEDWSAQEALALAQREAVQNPLPLEQLKIQAQSLELLYTFENADEIWPYLEQHQYLVPTLIELPNVAQKYFPDEGMIFEYFPDPEIPGEELLLVHIVTKLDVDAAYDLRSQLVREWRTIAGKKANHDLCIMMRYV